VKKNHVWFRFLLLIVIIGGLALVLYETGLIRLFCNKQRLLHFLQSLGPWGLCRTYFSAGFAGSRSSHSW